MSLDAVIAILEAAGGCDRAARILREMRGDATLQTRATLPGGVHEGKPYDGLDARHTAELDGDEAIVSESWHEADGSVRQRFAVRLPFSQLVHLVLNTTAEERAEIDARADWRGVP